MTALSRAASVHYAFVVLLALALAGAARSADDAITPQA